MSQKLTPLFEIDGSYMKKDSLIIPKFQIKVDENSVLYYKEKKVFTPKNRFSLITYEIIFDEFILITPILEKNKYNPAIYMYPKNQIKLYSLRTGRIYDTNLKGKRILEINEIEKKITVADFEDNEEIIKLGNVKKIPDVADL